MTYHPDSVLVENVAKARFAAIGPLPPRDWDATHNQKEKAKWTTTI